MSENDEEGTHEKEQGNQMKKCAVEWRDDRSRLQRVAGDGFTGRNRTCWR